MPPYKNNRPMLVHRATDVSSLTALGGLKKF